MDVGRRVHSRSAHIDGARHLETAHATDQSSKFLARSPHAVCTVHGDYNDCRSIGRWSLEISMRAVHDILCSGGTNLLLALHLPNVENPVPVP